MEQRVNLEFFCETPDNDNKSLGFVKRSIQAWICMSYQVYEGFKRFKERQETTKKDACPGWHWTSNMDANIQNIIPLIPQNCRLRNLATAELTRIDKDSVCQFLHATCNMKNPASFTGTMCQPISLCPWRRSEQSTVLNY